MLMLSYIISLPNGVAADETKTAAAEAKPYKILFQGNQALSETALRKAAAMTDAVPAAKKDGSCGCGCKERKAGEDAPVATPRRTERAAKAKLSQRRSTAQSNPTRAAALARTRSRRKSDRRSTNSLPSR